MSSQPEPSPGPTPKPSFDALYRAWFRPVVRWLPAMGIARGDIEDVAQEIFMIVERRHAGFDGNNPGGWLYAISLRVVSNHRRLGWVRRLLFTDDPPDVAATETPESMLQQQQLAGIGDEVLAAMTDKLRRVFVLFELEGYGGDEIAALEGIPLATVWTRLHNARKQFDDRAARIRRQRGLS